MYEGYSIDDIKGGTYLYDPTKEEEYTKLKKYPEFNVKLKKLSLNKVIQYVILVYDFSSELRKEIRDHVQRKSVAAKIVGYKISEITGKFETLVEEFLAGENEEVNEMVVRYVSLFGKPEYVQLTTYYELFIQENKALMNGGSREKLKALIEGMDKLTDKITELEEKLFGGKESIDFRQHLYASVEKKRLGIRAEEIAEDLANGKTPLGGYNPYGDYDITQTDNKSVDKSFKFVGDR